METIHKPRAKTYRRTCTTGTHASLPMEIELCHTCCLAASKPTPGSVSSTSARSKNTAGRVRYACARSGCNPVQPRRRRIKTWSNRSTRSRRGSAGTLIRGSSLPLKNNPAGPPEAPRRKHACNQPLSNRRSVRSPAPDRDPSASRCYRHHA